MYSIKKAFLKINYPFLKNINIKQNEGVFDLEGIDIHIFTTLYHILKNNEYNLIIDIDRPVEFNLSISNLFLELIPNTSVVIFDHLSDIAILNNLDDSKLKYINSQLEGGLISELAYNNKFLKVGSVTNLFKMIASIRNRSTLLTINFNKNTLENLKNFISIINSNSFLIYNTNTYDTETNLLRNYLLTKGYVFYSRINDQHDFFILSESINGFPSTKFNLIDDCTLAKWISLPPDSDYTRPR
jgi:hypothetical protein